MTDLSAAAPGFSPLDLGALLYFLAAWTAYGVSVSRLRASASPSAASWTATGRTGRGR